MSYESDIVGIRSENLIFQSDYVPFISFAAQEQKDAAEKYIFKETFDFFKDILKIHISVTQLSYPKLITQKDFTKVEISYFYENFFHDLGSRNPDGKLEEKLKWGITFDEECAPIQVAYLGPTFFAHREKAKLDYLDHREREGRPYRPHSQYLPYRRYGTIDINGTPFFYYIYFTLQEILDVIKQLPTS